MSALARTLLALYWGIPADPADAEELGRIFDRTPLHGTTPPETLRKDKPLMPNKPRPENPHRMVRVEDELWKAAAEAAAKEGTTRSEVMRQALLDLVNRNPNPEVDV